MPMPLPAVSTLMSDLIISPIEEEEGIRGSLEGIVSFDRVERRVSVINLRALSPLFRSCRFAQCKVSRRLSTVRTDVVLGLARNLSVCLHLHLTTLLATYRRPCPRVRVSPAAQTMGVNRRVGDRTGYVQGAVKVGG